MQKCDVPLIDVSVTISFVFFHTMFGAKIYNIVCFFSFVTNPSLAASMSGCRGRQPLQIFGIVYRAAKSLSLFADLTLYKDIVKAVQDLFSDTALFCSLVFVSSFIILHRLVGLRRMRLCPFLVSEVEQEIYSDRALPLDPTSPLAPGLTLRFIALFARCFPRFA